MILLNYQLPLATMVVSEPKENYKNEKPQYRNWGTKGGANYNWQNKKILIIDTDPVNCELLRMLFKSTLATTDVKSGPVAILNYKHEINSYELVILEVYLKGVNGIELLENIKKQDKSIPIVIYSVLNQSEIIEKCMELGCSVYLVKPDDVGRLLSVCDKVLSNLKI